MTETIIVGLISAASGLFGVIVGAILPWFRDRWSNKRQAGYLAIRVVCILDEFLEQCTSIVGDSGLCNPDGSLEAQVSQPNDLPLPKDVDWRSIDHGLMYKILVFPSRIQRDNRSISFAADNSFPPHYDEFYEERQYRYACLGLDAAALTQELQTTYGIPPQEFGHWNPVSYLKDEKAKIEQLRADRHKQPSIFDIITAHADQTS